MKNLILELTDITACDRIQASAGTLQALGPAAMPHEADWYENEERE
jgi:hypothetical protein